VIPDEHGVELLILSGRAQGLDAAEWRLGDDLHADVGAKSFDGER
jgi:hypothetical protein